MSVKVKYADVEFNENVVFKAPFDTLRLKSPSAFECRCDELGTEVLGIMPRAHVISI